METNASSDPSRYRWIILTRPSQYHRSSLEWMVGWMVVIASHGAFIQMTGQITMCNLTLKSGSIF
ncbi:uncharacterized protein BDW47DRAFT_104536 [Aspergillus candidus]|uniref:Uncharacterized protein n=1 Tax=Aspergillus candidus TaxID=41067 RepID=A0A2I2FDA7_ASPCN|nr:hypothetical protein BDW47DRAFT_104536 [Aspergillus candidus]PLB38602.1 hypothetical protein BDW47DRAFT_104536 [Aspergillus candidus]